ncbi:MAG: ABC transporter ATP-binding protein [Chlamydiota bacterium]
MTSLPKTLSRFLRYFLLKQKGRFAAIQILAFAWSFDNITWPLILRLLIDKITTFAPEEGNLWHDLTPLLIFWLCTRISLDLAYRTYGFLMASTFPQLESAIRMEMFTYIQDHSYHYFAHHFAGSISNRINDMAQSTTRILQLLFTLFMPAFLAFVIASILFYMINPGFAFFLVLWTCLHMGICFAGAKRCAHASEVHSHARSFLTGKVVDSLSNIVNVKLFASKDYECTYLGKYQKKERQTYTQALTIAEKINVALSISSLLFPGIFLTWYIIYSWQMQWIDVGSLVFIFNATWNIQHLAWFAGMELPNLYKEIGVCQQAMSLIRAEHEIQDEPDAKDLKIKKGRIVFEDVSFHYPDGKRIFQGLRATIGEGEKVGLVGFSGSGKSTFVNLIMRFFAIHSGAIKIEGTDIRTVTRQSLRSQISMIPQNPSLFHRTLWENIRYGNRHATQEEVLAASKNAHCHEFISSLPEGYATLVGERGIKLSGGQRQRIAIARALLADAPILILDEATSALDSVTETHIQEALHHLMRGRTTIVIAHRLSTLSEMDKILVFEKGAIVEEGNHKALLRSGGHYATMWQMQAGGFLPDTSDGMEVEW